MRNLLLATALLVAAPAAAQSSPAADAVSEDRLRADIEALVGFGTRHTLSSHDDPARGIGASLRWGEAQFRAASEACGGCLEIVLPERMVTGARIPEPTRLVNVVAIQRGSERPNEVVIVQGHIDSRVSDVMDAESDAPGANDNGSGTALTIEAARVLSRYRYPTTIVYALLSGEEQGLHGGSLLADYAAEQGWSVKAVLNNDIVGGSCGSDGHCDDAHVHVGIVGGSCGSDGHCDDAHVRVFSEGPRADADDEFRAGARRNGGENDSPGRNLSRWLADLAAEDPQGLAVRQIWRTDRMGRGGDHIPFLDKGFPAVRFSVAVEDYEHQHQDLRTEDGVTYGDTIDEMDFPYLAKVTRLNVRAAEALAKAPMPPAPVAEAAVRTDTLVSWNAVPAAAAYHVWKRRTDQPGWEDDPVRLPAGGTIAGDLGEVNAQTRLSIALDLRGDDWIFGVSSVAADGSESPIASAVPGGAFAPLGTD